MQKVSIIIPAHNEQGRIGRTLDRYVEYFNNQNYCTVELVVVLNGCADNTLSVVKEAQKKTSMVRIIDLLQAGKGLAIKTGFLNALECENDLIGFVKNRIYQPQNIFV